MVWPLARSAVPPAARVVPLCPAPPWWRQCCQSGSTASSSAPGADSRARVASCAAERENGTQSGRGPCALTGEASRGRRSTAGQGSAGGETLGVGGHRVPGRALRVSRRRGRRCLRPRCGACGLGPGRPMSPQGHQGAGRLRTPGGGARRGRGGRTRRPVVRRCRGCGAGGAESWGRRRESGRRGAVGPSPRRAARDRPSMREGQWWSGRAARACRRRHCRLLRRPSGHDVRPEADVASPDVRRGSCRPLPPHLPAAYARERSWRPGRRGRAGRGRSPRWARYPVGPFGH